MVVLSMDVSKGTAVERLNGLVKAFNVAKFIGMYEVKGWSADEFMGFVTCLY